MEREKQILNPGKNAPPDLCRNPSQVYVPAGIEISSQWWRVILPCTVAATQQHRTIFSNHANNITAGAAEYGSGDAVPYWDRMAYTGLAVAWKCIDHLIV